MTQLDLQGVSSSTVVRLTGVSSSTGAPDNYVDIDTLGRVTSKLNDGVGNSVTSTLINSKQRLDINSPSEGADGSTAPFYSVQIAGKDGSGNLQAVLTDTLGNQAILLKDSSGTAITVGQKVSANSIPVVIASDQTPLSTKTPLTGSAPAVNSVGTSSAQAIASNANRKGLVFVNTSTSKISLGIGSVAVLNSGITLYPGGAWTMDEFTFSTAVINAIAAAASSSLSIQEFTT